MQQVIASVPNGLQVYYYRTSGGAEIDILMQLSDGQIWAVEVKRSLKPTPRRGFYEALGDVKPSRAIVVYSGVDRQRLRDGIDVMSVADLLQELRCALGQN